MAAPSSDCGLDIALRVVAGKWKPTILWVLHERALHFGELSRELGNISEKVLTAQLRELESDGVLVRSEHAQGRVKRVLYSLTAEGHELNTAVHALALWGTARPPQVEPHK